MVKQEGCSFVSVMNSNTFNIGQDRLDAYIAKLLYDYDCVIVPQLGGFVTNYRPAIIDEERGLAQPPGKDIRFNKNLTKSDGLLAKTIADAADMTFEEADVNIHRAVENYMTELESGKRVTFNKIGVLYFDQHKTLRFSPSNEANFLKEAMGFTSFALPEPLVSGVLHPESAEPIIGAEGSSSLSRRPSYTRGIYWVAAATLLPFIGLSIYIGLKTDFESPANLSLADLLPEASAMMDIAPQYTPRLSAETTSDDEPTSNTTNFPENTAVFPFSFDDNALDSAGVWINLNKRTPKSVEATMESNASTDILSTTDGLLSDSDVHGLYHIIVGCFGEHENAEDYIDNLREKGYPAAMLDHHKNLYRVRLMSYTDYRTALGELKTFRKESAFSGAWMLKKRVP